jgi:nucleotide-binding universal stress UspA family protein
MSSDQQARQQSDLDTKKGHRIVVGIDGSNSSLSALEWAARQAEFTDASLDIVASWEWPTSYGWSVVPGGYDPSGDLRSVIEPILETLRVAHPRVVVQAKILEGHPAPVLIRESMGAELLVVGSRGHGEFVGMLIGSVSEHCVANASCPVVVFRDKA